MAGTRSSVTVDFGIGRNDRLIAWCDQSQLLKGISTGSIVIYIMDVVMINIDIVAVDLWFFWYCG